MSLQYKMMCKLRGQKHEEILDGESILIQWGMENGTVIWRLNIKNY